MTNEYKQVPNWISSEFHECQTCFAIVHNQENHDKWHQDQNLKPYMPTSEPQQYPTPVRPGQTSAPRIASDIDQLKALARKRKDDQMLARFLVEEWDK